MIAAAIGGFPGAGYVHRAEGAGSRVRGIVADYNDGHVRAAAEIVRRGVIERPRAVTFDGFVGGAGEHGRGRVTDRDGLGAGDTVAAAVGHLPRSNNDLRAWTARRAVGVYVGSGIKQGHGQIRAAAGIRHAGRVEDPLGAALDCLIGRTSDRRRASTDYRHRLGAIRAVAAAIVNQPGLADHLRALAVGWDAAYVDKHIGAAADVARSRRIECPGRAALNRLIGRAIHNWRSGIHDRDGLFAGWNRPAAVNCLPGAGDDLRAGAVRKIALHRNRRRNAAAESGSRWRVKRPTRAAFDGFVGRTGNARSIGRIG